MAVAVGCVGNVRPSKSAGRRLVSIPADDVIQKLLEIGLAADTRHTAAGRDR